MACETTKCCGCAPLRPGLLAWAYIKLVLILGLTGWHLYLCVVDFQYAIYSDNQSRPFLLATKMILIMLPVGVCFLHLVFTAIFIIGVHHENYDALQVYLVYFIFEVAVASGWAGYSLYTGIIENYNRNLFWLRKILPVVINILWTIYLTVLVGSDLHLLKKAGGETSLPRPVIKEQDRRRDTVYTNATQLTPDRRKPLFPVEELEMLRQQMGLTDKHYKLLLVFLVYSMTEAVSVTGYLGYKLFDAVMWLEYHYYGVSVYSSGSFVLIVVYISLSIYLIVLVKSEMQLLKKDSDKASAIIDKFAKKEQDKQYDIVYANATPARGKPLFPVEELERARKQLGVKNV